MVKFIGFDVIWSRRSLQQLKDIFSYIEKESPQGARKVVKAVSLRVQSLSTDAMIYGRPMQKK